MVHIRRKHAEELLRQDFYRPRELADLLGTSVEFINHEISTRRLKARRVGRTIADIPRSAVLDWLEARGIPGYRATGDQQPPAP